MINNIRKYNYIEEYINTIRAKGGYSFSYSDLINEFDVSTAAINLALQRLKAHKAIAQVRKGFYVILPPEYESKGILPPVLFIDDLMKSIHKSYYIAVLSAATFYGASHQAPMEFFVVTSGDALRDIKTQNLKINFLIKKNWSEESVMKKNSDAGYINVSTPELTALDLLYYSGIISLNRAYTILQELYTALKPSALYKIASDFPQVSAIQRLGYLLDVYLKNAKLSDALQKVLSNKKIYYIPLSCHKLRKGKTNSKWKIIINTEVEGDL